MNAPDAIHFSAHPQTVDIQSRPTHLIQIGWTVGEFNPRWVVMLREEGAPTIIHLDATPSGLNFVALTAAKQALLALKIPVLTVGLDLGDLPPSAPFNFDGVFLAMKNSLNCFRAPTLSCGLRHSRNRPRIDATFAQALKKRASEIVERSRLAA